MTRPEFLDWLAFYELHPFDDYHRIYRPAAMTAASLGGGSIADRLQWLQPPPRMPSQYSEVDISFLNAFGIKPPPTLPTANA